MRKFVLIALLVTFCAGAQNSYQSHRRKAFRVVPAAGGGGGLTSPDIDEKFEATGTPGYDVAGWSEVIGAGNTVDENYTTSPAPLDGAQSLRIIQQGFDTAYISRSLTANASYLFYWMLHPVTIGGDDEMLTLWSGGGGAQEAEIVLLSNGKLRIDLIDGSTVDTVGAITTGTTWHIYVSYAGGGKTMTVAFSSDGSRPTSGDNFATDTTTGDADTIDTVGAFGHNGFNANSESIFDKFQAKQGTTW